MIDKYAAIHPDFLDVRVRMLNEAIGHYRPLLPYWPQMGAAVGEMINSAVNGIMTNEEALPASDVEIKSEDQQAVLAIHRARDLVVRQAPRS